jgi:hypothetical protein
MRDIYSIWEIYTPSERYILHLRDIYSIWEIYTPYERYILHMRDIYSIWEIYTPYERYILHMQVLSRNVATYELKVHNGKNWNHLFCRKVSFLTALHCQFRGVGQGMKQTYLYLWSPLFQAQLDRCDQRNRQNLELFSEKKLSI